MPLDVVAVQVLLAVVLFFLANWLGRHSISSGYHAISLLETVDEAPAFNFVFRAATPLVYIAIVAALLYGAGLDRYVQRFYAVVIYYFGVRWLYNILVGRGRLLNWPLQIATAGFTVGCAFLLNQKVLASRGTLLPDPQGLNSNIWLVIIIYVFTVLNRVPIAHPGAAKRRQRYLLRRLRALKAGFGAEISPLARTSTEEALVYSVLIYETFNRPRIYQAIERRILFPVGLSKTLGPMQVEAGTAVSDRASVREGATKLLEAFRRHLAAAEAGLRGVTDPAAKTRYAESMAIQGASHEYNIRGDYPSQVESIYRALIAEGAFAPRS